MRPVLTYERSVLSDKRPEEAVNMKRIWLLLIAAGCMAALASSVTGCGGTDSSDEASAAGEPAGVMSETGDAPSAETAPPGTAAPTDAVPPTTTEDRPGPGAARPDSTGPVPETPAGLTVFLADRCDLCHTVYAAGVGKPPEGGETADESDSMDLSEVGAERSPDWLRSYLRGEELLEGVKHYRAFEGSEEDEAALIAWLAVLGAISDTVAPEAVGTADGPAQDPTDQNPSD
jgi:hypothetical protein